MRRLTIDPSDGKARHGAILGQLDLPQGRLQMHLASAGPDVFNHGLTKALGGIAIKKSHL